MASSSSYSGDNSFIDYRSIASRACRKKMHWKSNLFQFRSFILSVGPSDSHIEWLSKTPFSWVLDIPESPNIRGFVQNMFDNWDYEAKCFIFQDVRVNFTMKDVSLILGLPNHGDVVPMHVDAAFSQLYLQHFQDSHCSKKDLEKKLIQIRRETNPASVILFYCVDDLDNLDKYNWCEALYNYMAPQMEAIGTVLSLRPKPQNLESTKKPMLKGFARLLAVWMCEHIPIERPYNPYVTPRICRWKWRVSHVGKIKKMIEQLPSDQIIVDLLPSESELPLISNGTMPPVLARGVGCQSCKEKDELLVARDDMLQSMHKRNQELLYLLERSDNSKDKLLAEKDKTIEKLVNLLERSFNNNEKIIAQKEKKILKLQALLESKAIEESQATPSKDVVNSDPHALEATTIPKQPKSMNIKIKRCARKTIGYVFDDKDDATSAWFTKAESIVGGTKMPLKEEAPKGYVKGKEIVELEELEAPMTLPAILTEREDLTSDEHIVQMEVVKSKQSKTYFNNNKDAIVADRLKLNQLNPNNMTSQSGKVEGDGMFSSQKTADSACCPKSETSFQICSPMSRPAYGTDGRVIQLLSNHFNVKFTRHDAVFYNYSITIKSNNKIDDTTPTSKSLGRKILDKLYQTYSSELNGKEFAYDGAKSLFTVGPLPQNNFEFAVVLDDSSSRSVSGNPRKGSLTEGDQKRLKHSFLTRTYNVEIRFATMIPLETIAHAVKGIDSEHTHDALRVLDIILRQQHAKRDCLLIKQSFFDGNHANFVDLGGGVTGCRGIHTSFRTTRAGLSLNIDVSTTLIMSPGPVLNFLLANQNVQNPLQIDWVKAKRMLKNIRIKTEHNKKECKITGISELPCNQQLFNMKVRNSDGKSQMVEVTVYDYFRENHNIELTWSAYAPCLDVGKPTRPNYLPVELCHLIPLQRYTKALSSQQRASLVEKSRQKPRERISVVTNVVKKNQYDEDPILSACGLYIDKQLMKLDGRVLHAPKLKIGNEEDIVPENGRWNFNQKRLFRPVKIGQKDQYWAIVNFSARCDLSYLSRELLNCARSKGIHMERPYTIIEEDRQWLKSSPVVRVERMFEKMMPHIPEKPQFLLCVLPEKKNSEIYGPWKKKNLVEMGIVTQCISPNKINDQYLTNVLLKINSKLGGINSLLAIECTRNIPLINECITMIFGMDVSHGSHHSDFPSVAAVVGSREWPLVSRYRASVTTQSSKLEMIDSLFKLGADGKDEGMIRELLVDFYNSTNFMKPTQIIIFRDGVSESQFNQVLNVELTQFLKVFEHLGEPKPPKFTLIVAQKNHHTKLFLTDGSKNVPPGTVVDTMVVHPRNYDFYMCPQAGMIGTSRPVHYNVLLDEIGFSPDDLQRFVHSLSYVYQRSTSAVSMVAPICYAHLAASQMSQFIKLDAMEEPSSEASAGERPAFPQLPKLHENVRHTMFFC